jgi:predicted ArsR family transcriptional regulator
VAGDETTVSGHPLLTGDFDADVTSIAALAEPLRRSLYLFVAAQSQPVSREEAADGVRIPLHVAKFHLDKLVDEGLLEFEYRRPPGRGGPGAGRPAKVYRRSEREITVSLPRRRYELAGQLLAQAATDAGGDGQSLASALKASARNAGRSLGETVLARCGRRAGRSQLREGVVGVLDDGGYEPRRENGRLILGNCPFHSLARDFTDLACGLNLGLLQGLLEQVEDAALDATLDPAQGRCCVVVREK